MSENKNPNVILTLNLDEVNAILAAIQELPARIANPISKKITDQANYQLAPVDPEQITPIID